MYAVISKGKTRFEYDSVRHGVESQLGLELK